MSNDNRIVDEDYIGRKTEQQIEITPESELDWFDLYAKKQFDYRSDKELMKKIRKNIVENRAITPRSVYYDSIKTKIGINTKKENYVNRVIKEAMMVSQIEMGTSEKEKLEYRKLMLMRQSAWCVLLGVDFTSPTFQTFESMYWEVLNNNKPEEDSQNRSLVQIRLDVVRTYHSFNLKFLNSDVTKGRNKLYNLLKVYALVLDPEVGYTQGMNFIAALILMHVPNEVLACQIFMKVLEKDDWARLYL